MNKQGLSLLLVVIVVGTATLILAMSAAFLSIGDLDIGFTQDLQYEARAIADGCADEGLRRLRFEGAYTGDTLSLGDGSCILSIASNGALRTLYVTSTLSNVRQVLRVDASISGTTVTASDWEYL
ncbi:MAG: hypothetical protein COU35_04615 [Candidatus Magasanikbacteria bacterium CG10_big_fil_rev_8_21_14_0_10_47_10]|uniref:Type 4 fimbrial biogenesis protein PilX N-terminal domain-containing protein n=1 Tax=Candidatus Magasanikbacteria bacterium CG10_big_fil_rev_8_21_14_0_10_47_10 TaxID=1974652 RepID=A0A2H0TPK3_9BACT|nr:MAG: hypothetical protein COU35_04615 [Candidatus Magasanikbacteria bacterium CG10_big_fil_rev_8_21_14_0_10_47_10]